LLNVRDWLLGTVRSTLLIPAATALGVALVTACNDTMGPRPSVTVSVLGQPTRSYAADSAGQQLIVCDVALQARNGGEESAGWMDATFAFYAVNDAQTPFAIDTIPAHTVGSSWGADSIGTNTDETARWKLIGGIPFTMKMRFPYGWAKGSVASSEVSLSCKPPTPAGPPPTITTLRDQVDTAPEPSDTLHVNYAANSPVGLWQTRIHVTGPCDVTVSVPENLQLAATHDVGVQLPAACSLGVPVRVTAIAFDLGLQQTSRSLTLRGLVDHRPPRLGPWLSTPYNNLARLPGFTGYLFTGDAMTLLVNAIDNHALHGVYWEVLPTGPRDSMLVNDSALSQAVTIRAQAGWSGAIHLRLYAKDAVGNVSDTVSSGAIQVGPTVGQSPTVTSITGDIGGLAFDAKRGVIYLLQPNSLKISVFSPTSLTVLGTIPLTDFASGFDLSPSGDSIVMVLRNSQAIGIVDLTHASPALQTVRLPSLDSSYKLLNIRVASTGRALIATQNVALDSGGVKRLYTYDLASGTLRVRLDAPVLGYEAGGALERSGDGRVIVVNGETGAFVRYDVASDTFEPALTARIPDRRLSIDSAGAHVAVAGDLYDASLHYLLTVGVARSGAGPDAISSNGETHYMALAPTYVQGNYVSPGIVRSHVSDGSMIDRIPVLMRTTLVRVSPDGSMLAAAGTYYFGGYNNGPAISLINLTQLH